MYTYIYMSGITNEVYALYTRVFLNSLTKEYETIITIDRMPIGQSPLRDLTMQINLPSLSPFQPRGRNACANTSCAVALKSLAEDYYYVGQSRFIYISNAERLYCGYKLNASDVKSGDGSR